VPHRRIPALVLGGSGYVAGETIRLLLSHPEFEIGLVTSGSHAGKRIDDAFPHLTGPIGSQTFGSPQQAESYFKANKRIAVFAALPHGEGAAIVGPMAALSGKDAHIVDMSADFRFSDPKAYHDVYGAPHRAPGALKLFHCGLPDIDQGLPSKHISHPGCFVTATTLACAPLVDRDLANGSFYVSAITGSTGSGATPKPTTHHPTRNGAVWAYEPLRHRHGPEIAMLLRRMSTEPVSVAFIPHSGPFSRGIHATVFTRLRRAATVATLVDVYADFYRQSPFVRVSEKMPSLREVAGTNRCHIGIAVEGLDVAITSVIDNLVKGAAGGAVQWMNRQFELDESAGLEMPGVGWA